MSESGQAWVTRIEILKAAIQRLFGYDFFISYAWHDGRPYAEALVRRLSLKPYGYRCFIDQKEMGGGEAWRTSVRTLPVFGPDSRWLIGRGYEEKLCLWDVRSGHFAVGPLFAVESKSDASNASSGLLLLWDLRAGEAQPTRLETSEIPGISDVLFSSDDYWLAV